MVEYENLKVDILVLWGKFKGKEKVASDTGLHKPFLQGKFKDRLGKEVSKVFKHDFATVSLKSSMKLQKPCT